MGLVFYSLQAQNLPQGISYQAVAIKKEKVNLGGENLAYIYWSKKDIVVRFSIYDAYPGGSVEYSETHDTKTDDYGVFNLIIGRGDKVSGIFEEINWELGDAHLKVEIDFDGFGKFELIGIEKFWSVPYAFVSKKQGANNSGNDSLFLDLYGKYNYLRDRDKDTVIGNEGGVSYEYLDSVNRVLSDSIRKLQVLVSRDQDTVVGNEWQDLSKKADSILISNGIGIKLLDDDSTNEIQELMIVGDSVTLSGSKNKISILKFRDTSNSKGFTTIGDTSNNVLLTQIPQFDCHCESQTVNNFGFTQYTVDQIVEYGDSIYYIGWYNATAGSRFPGGEFIVGLSKKDCGRKIVFRSPLNSYSIWNETAKNTQVYIGQYNEYVSYLKYESGNQYICNINLKTFQINVSTLDVPLVYVKPYGYTNKLGSVAFGSINKDTVYIMTAPQIQYGGGGVATSYFRLHKFSLKTGSYYSTDSITNFEDFGSGVIQFNDSVIYKSSANLDKIYSLYLRNSVKRDIWDLTSGKFKTDNVWPYFVYFPSVKVVYYPVSPFSYNTSFIVRDIQTKKLLFDKDLSIYKLNIINFTSLRNKSLNNLYLYGTDWNALFYYVKEPIIRYYK